MYESVGLFFLFHLDSSSFYSIFTLDEIVASDKLQFDVGLRPSSSLDAFRLILRIYPCIHFGQDLTFLIAKGAMQRSFTGHDSLSHALSVIPCQQWPLSMLF